MTCNAKPGRGAGSCESLWLVRGTAWSQYVAWGSHRVSVLGRKPASSWTCIWLECSAGVLAVHVCACVYLCAWGKLNLAPQSCLQTLVKSPVEEEDVCVCVEVTRCHGLIPGPERILGRPWPKAAILTSHGPVFSHTVATLQP